VVSGWNPAVHGRDLIANFSTLARPETKWTQRVGDQPSGAMVTADGVIVTMRGSIEGRAVDSGSRTWQTKGDWAAIAGAEPDQVVMVGRGGGLVVLDPGTGAQRWQEPAAAGAWGYRDSVLVLSCGRSGPCELSAREPGSGAVRWRSAAPGLGNVNGGANPAVAGVRELSSDHQSAARAVPRLQPAALGVPTERRVEVFELTGGRRGTPVTAGANARVAVIGGRVLVATATRRAGSCQHVVEARDPLTGSVVWRKEGYDLGTVSGVNCEPRRDPAGGGTVLAARRADRRPVALSARDGRELWVGEVDETIAGLDGTVALVRSVDRATVSVINLSTGRISWSHPAPTRAAATITRYAVVIGDRDEGRLVAYAPGDGRTLVDVRSGADVVGVGPAGLLLGRGRTLGLLPF